MKTVSFKTVPIPQYLTLASYRHLTQKNARRVYLSAGNLPSETKAFENKQLDRNVERHQPILTAQRVIGIRGFFRHLQLNILKNAKKVTVLEDEQP